MSMMRKQWGLIALATPLLLAGSLALPTTAAAQGPAAVAPSVRGLPDFTDLVDQVGPAVVNIRTVERMRAGAAGRGGQMDQEMQEFFRRFFGIPMPNTPRPQGPRADPQEQPEREGPRGVGSGFIISADGFVMTNAHVVDGADEVLVTLPDKREFKAKLIGADKRTDVAVVKIDATGLPFVRIGDINRLRVGEWVMAIGSPFGLENTVTAGIVSAKQRDTGDYLPFIQTDVAINPGNSGGPLINMRGEVVGINSQIYSRSGGFMGISFAIPMDEAIRVSDQLRATGKVSRGRIGVQIGPVDKEVAESIGLGSATGVLVSAVEPDSPAAKAGLQAGDVIVQFNGTKIDKVSDLPRLVGNTKPGSKASLTIFRRGKQQQLSITVADVPADESQVAQAPEASGATANAKTLGLRVTDLTAAQKKALGVRGGVQVAEASGPAARAGMRPGDVVLAIANTEVASVKDFEAALAKADQSKPVNVLVRRDEWAQYLLIRPQK